MFRIALTLLALRIVDVNFLQPAPGTGPTDHLVSGLVPLALLGLVAYAYPRLRSGGAQGVLALATGLFGVTIGVDAVHYARELGLSSDDVSGLISIPAGLTLMGLGARDLWRSRRADRWRYPRRVLYVAGLYLGVGIIIVPVGLGYVGTKVGRAVVPANHLGVPYENVKFETKDGLELEGWYIPSENGAAVISFPGRSGPQRQARMLARHGYGVLLFDRRGEGRSEGEPNVFGWGGDEDIKAAVRYLQTRDDLDPQRIGGIGLSVGGELMLEAAAETPDLRAVVSDGAGARTARETIDTEGTSTTYKLLSGISNGLKDATMMIATGQTPPKHLKDLVGKIAPRPLLLIADPESANGEKLTRLYYKHAKQPKALWEIPGAGHVNGAVSRKAEYEQRIVSFFDDAL
jgi:fermentation-respiration switch protein FrsA (DUF1100 family)